MPTFVPHDAPVLAPLPTRVEAAQWVERVDNALKGNGGVFAAMLALSNLQCAYARATVRFEQLEARREADDESPANARLISAAPDLLEALETALDTLREIRVSRQSDAESVSDTIGLIETAIAKAVVS